VFIFNITVELTFICSFDYSIILINFFHIRVAIFSFFVAVIFFDEECLGFLDQRKQTKVQWAQDPSQSNVDNLNSVKHEASRHFRNKKKAYLKAKIEELESNSKIKNIRDLYRGIIDFKKGYKPRTNIVKDEKGGLVADSRSILARWRNHFSQLFNIHGGTW